MSEGSCALCGGGQQLTFHHLIPRSCHRNKWFRKQFELQDMRERGVTLCRPCHSFIHRQFPEKILGRELNTLQALQAEPAVQRHVAWVRKRIPRG